MKNSYIKVLIIASILLIINEITKYLLGFDKLLQNSLSEQIIIPILFLGALAFMGYKVIAKIKPQGGSCRAYQEIKFKCNLTCS